MNQVVELQETLKDLINAYLETNTMSIAELIGVLQMAILDVYSSELEDEDED